MNKTNLLLCLITAIGLSACAATKRKVPFRISASDPVSGKMARNDYSKYEPVPDTPTNLVYRAVLKAVPYTRERAFWGRWAGSGCEGGRPIDEMDEIFRRHDIAYRESKALKTMQWADTACVEALKKLDTRKMSAEALAFHKRSMAFFSNPEISLIGKPFSSYIIVREEKGCPFQCEDDMRELFGLKRVTTPAPSPRLQKRAASDKRMLASAKPKKGKRTPRTPDTVAAKGRLVAGNSAGQGGDIAK